jgi:protein gp37
MSENSKIEWTDHTFNGWEGCQKVGPGCDHCYAETRNARFAGGTAVNWGPGAPRRRTSPANWRKPLAWNRDGTFYAIHGRRQRVFCASLSDWLDNSVPVEWRADLLDLVRQTPNLDWLLLTKRIGNWMKLLQEASDYAFNHRRDDLYAWIEGWLKGNAPANVLIGATIVNQEEADRDIEKLLMTPARRRFLSMEPLLGPVDLRAWFDPTGVCCMQEMQSCADCPADAPWIHGPTTEYAEDGTGYSSPEIDWVIVGGESGPGARPMHPEWARDLRDQCAAAGVPFLFKQWGEWLPVEPNGCAVSGCGVTPVRETAFRFAANHHFTKVGKRDAGRELDGRTHDEFPEER